MTLQTLSITLNTASIVPLPMAASVISSPPWEIVTAAFATPPGLQSLNWRVTSLNTSSTFAISADTKALISSSKISFFASARILNLPNASSISSFLRLKPSLINLSLNACLPECLPKTIEFLSSPMSVAFMISYVSICFNTPSWCMPLSWAKAFLPTIALFGCGSIPVMADTSLLVG